MQDTSKLYPTCHRPAESFGRIGRCTLSTATLQAITERLGRWAEQSRRRARTRATLMALRELDARTLRDLGFDRSEILSVAIATSAGLQSSRIDRLQTPCGSF